MRRRTQKKPLLLRTSPAVRQMWQLFKVLSEVLQITLYLDLKWRQLEGSFFPGFQRDRKEETELLARAIILPLSHASPGKHNFSCSLTVYFLSHFLEKGVEGELLFLPSAFAKLRRQHDFLREGERVARRGETAIWHWMLKKTPHWYGLRNYGVPTGDEVVLWGVGSVRVREPTSAPSCAKAEENGL